MTKKKIEKINIFQLRAIKDTNKAKILRLGYIYSDTCYEDEEIIIDKEKKSTVKEIIDDIYLKMYKCRMTDKFVSTNKKLPLLYASLFYQKKFVTGYLFSIYVYFEIVTNTNKIQSLESLLNTDLIGKYTIEIVMDNRTEVIEIDNFQGYEETINQLMEIIETEEMKNIMKIELKKRNDERKERLGEIIEHKPIEPKYNFNELLKKYENGEDIDEIMKGLE